MGGFLSFDSLLLPPATGWELYQAITMWRRPSGGGSLHFYPCLSRRDNRAIPLPLFFVRARPGDGRGLLPFTAHPAPVLERMNHIWLNSTPIQQRAVKAWDCLPRRHPDRGLCNERLNQLVPSAAAGRERQKYSFYFTAPTAGGGIGANLLHLAPPKQHKAPSPFALVRPTQRPGGSGISITIGISSPDGWAASSRSNYFAQPPVAGRELFTHVLILRCPAVGRRFLVQPESSCPNSRAGASRIFLIQHRPYDAGRVVVRSCSSRLGGRAGCLTHLHAAPPRRWAAPYYST